MGFFSNFTPEQQPSDESEGTEKQDDGLVHCCGKVRFWGKKRKVVLRWVGIFFVCLVLIFLPVCIWVLREELNSQLHIIAWFVAGCFALLTLPISSFGIILHLNHYNKPLIQRYILRIMWMPPIYGLACWFSLLFRHYSVYWTLLREFYEAYCIYCFLFFLMALLEDNAKEKTLAKEDREKRRLAGEIVPEPEEQPPAPEYGRKWLCCGERILRPQLGKWCGPHRKPTVPREGHPHHDKSHDPNPHAHHIFPLCWLPQWSMEPIPRPNCYFPDSHLAANCRYGVLLYVVLKIMTSIATFILVLCGVYGDGQFKVNVGYPYCALVYNAAQLWAMYCLVLFYHTYVKELAPYRPFPKFCAIKAVVFFAFWQSVIIAGAVSDGIIAKPAETLYTSEEISAGLQDLIIAIEMFFAAWFHLYAFSHQDYKQDGAERLSVFQMIATIFDVKDVAVDLHTHAKVHADVIKRIVKDSKPDRTDMERSSSQENSQPTTTIAITTTATPATTTSTSSSSSTTTPITTVAIPTATTTSRTSSAPAPTVLLNIQNDPEVSNRPKTTTVTVKEGATVVPVTVTTSGPVASVSIEVEKS